MTRSDFLKLDTDNEIQLTGHQIRPIDIARRYQEGFSVEGIVGHYPGLNLPLVHKAIAYFLDIRRRRCRLSEPIRTKWIACALRPAPRREVSWNCELDSPRSSLSRAKNRKRYEAFLLNAEI